jgi:hypothetical protein
MSTQPDRSPSLSDLAREQDASAEQIVASAVALYAALPPAVRSAMIDALRSPVPGAHATLINELVRTVVIHEMRQRREAVRERVNRGEIPALPDLSDEELGAEAVRLVKESRRRRAATRE